MDFIFEFEAVVTSARLDRVIDLAAREEEGSEEYENDPAFSDLQFDFHAEVN